MTKVSAKLTKRQQEILLLIQTHIRSTGSPPTRAEIAKTMGFRSPNAAEDHLRALAQKGVIELVPGTSRGIRLTQTAGIPVVTKPWGKAPLLAEEHIEAHVSHLDRSLMGSSIDFLYRVGDRESSSLPAGILPGDYLAIHQTNHVKPNQLALVRINQEVSLQVYSSEIQAQHPVIEGLVLGVIRSLHHPLS